jgi:ribosomal protein L11 methyltransferase
MRGSITCISGDAASVTAEPAPLVLANILATVHARLAPVYRGLVEPGGGLVLGGMLETEAEATAAVAERNGFALRSALTRDGWTTLELSRRA